MCHLMVQPGGEEEERKSCQSSGTLGALPPSAQTLKTKETKVAQRIPGMLVRSFPRGRHRFLARNEWCEAVRQDRARGSLCS